MIRSLLVLTNFSAIAMKPDLFAASIAAKSGATVYLLHVIEPLTGSIRHPYPLHERFLKEITNNWMKVMKKIQNSMAAACPAVIIETEIVKEMTIPSILDLAGNNQIDLNLKSTKGAAGLKEIFMGSIAAGNIGKSKMPVLAIPDEYEKEEPEGILFTTNHFDENKTLLNKIMDVTKLFFAFIFHSTYIHS